MKVEFKASGGRSDGGESSHRVSQKNKRAVASIYKGCI